MKELRNVRYWIDKVLQPGEPETADKADNRIKQAVVKEPEAAKAPKKRRSIHEWLAEAQIKADQDNKERRRKQTVRRKQDIDL